MPSYSLVFDRASIVLLGRFNPAIFHPAWFARHSLIRDEECKQAKDLIVTGEVAQFQVDWLTVQVTHDRFGAHTDDTAHSAPLRDLVVAAFALLEHTPFWAVGMNRHVHYKVESEDQWHRFGHMLAPKEAWSRWLKNPGMRIVTMWGSRDEAPNARIQIQVEPSQRIRPGIYFAFNEHHAVNRKEEPGAGEEITDSEQRRALIDALAKGWENAQNYARTVAEGLLSLEY